MSKAQQAAEERWPSYPAIGFSGAADRQAAFVAGVAWALPENPDPAVIEAMADIIKEQTGYGYGGGDVEQVARAVYVVMRGAMQ